MNGLTILLICSVLGLIGYAIGAPKGRGRAGLALGFFLGLIGLVIIACLKPLPPPTYVRRQHDGPVQADDSRHTRVG